MSKFIQVNNLMKCVYEDAQDIAWKRNWGEDPVSNINFIEGRQAEEQAAELGIILTGKLSEGVGYIFHKTLNGKLTPHHVTMRAKTIANLERGSRKYGTAKIMRETLEDF